MQLPSHSCHVSSLLLCTCFWCLLLSALPKQLPIDFESRLRPEARGWFIVFHSGTVYALPPLSPQHNCDPRRACVLTCMYHHLCMYDFSDMMLPQVLGPSSLSSKVASGDKIMIILCCWHNSTSTAKLLQCSILSFRPFYLFFQMAVFSSSPQFRRLHVGLVWLLFQCGSGTSCDDHIALCKVGATFPE
jgi:hypothetical protein